MYCTQCGAANEEKSLKCLKCGELLEGTVPSAQQGPIKVKSYLAPAIMTTLCCCVPFGIVAIVYSAQTNAKAAVGDAAGAIACSRMAKIWTWVAFGAGLVLGLFYLLTNLASVMAKTPALKP